MHTDKQRGRVYSVYLNTEIGSIVYGWMQKFN